MDLASHGYRNDRSQGRSSGLGRLGCEGQMMRRMLIMGVTATLALGCSEDAGRTQKAPEQLAACVSRWNKARPTPVMSDSLAKRERGANTALDQFGRSASVTVAHGRCSIDYVLVRGKRKEFWRVKQVEGEHVVAWQIAEIESIRADQNATLRPDGRMKLEAPAT